MKHIYFILILFTSILMSCEPAPTSNNISNSNDNVPDNRKLYVNNMNCDSTLLYKDEHIWILRLYRDDKILLEFPLPEQTTNFITK